MSEKILITGKDSYIGNQLASWLSKDSKKYEVIKESVRNGRWKQLDFSLYDVVVHVAGIAHQDTKENQEDLYYKINTRLTIDIAKKAKLEGVKQFIFISSMIVYGESSKIGETKIITRETIPEPINFYGNSKLLAEQGILPMQSNFFNVVVIRPPMIYGKNSKGNYPLLSKAAQNLIFFPDIDNKRSMLHIDNLCEFLKVMIDQEEKGIFFPQNKEYVKTSTLVNNIAKFHGKKIFMIKFFNIFIKNMSKYKMINKIFGNLTYDHNMSYYGKAIYQIRNLEESIKLTEKRD